MSTLRTTNLQNASAASPAIVLAADGSATAQLSSINGGPLAGMRNRIINGDMRIDQRNNGGSVTASSGITFGVDRWFAVTSSASKLSIQQNAGAVTPPVGFSNYVGLTSLSAYSLLSSDFFTLQQAIEGFNIADLNWGTASAASVTLSFWVRSSLTGMFGGAIYNSNTDRSYPFAYTISAANTWEQKSITIPGDTTGAWLTNNGAGMRVNWGLGVGTTDSGTAGAWSTGLKRSATGATSVVGTNGATFYITGVQLEAGTVATPFERRSIGAESLLCLRYYCGQRIDAQLPVPGQSVVRFNFPVSMRIPPTITNLVAGSLSNATVAVEAGGITNEGFYFQYQTSANNGFIIGRFNAAFAEL